jgi:class 3 adenylate cyclase
MMCAAHEDDAIRGVLSALMICAKLHDLGKCPAIGITTGPAFCGVVGSRGRREYSVLGDTVNLSARLMQHASVLGGGVIVDPHTQFATRYVRGPCLQCLSVGCTRRAVV